MAEPKEPRHAWLDLLDVDGPFLSRPALDNVFDAAWPPRISSDHRALLAPPEVRPTEWDEALPLVERMLTDVLGYRPGKTLILQPIDPVHHPIHSKAAVTPYAIAHVALAADQPRMIVLAGPDAAPTPDALDPKAMTDHMGWPSTPVQRAALAARGVGADIALVTNGHDHLIVWVGSGVTGYAWVDPKLHRLERRLADAFVALVAAPTVTATADTSTSDLLKLSQEKQVDVTEKLGLQVRRAAESLVNAVSRANRNTDGRLLAGVEPREVYSGVVTVLMRTVFLLNAEERNLISSGDLWDRAYAVSTLLAQLDDSYYLHQGVMRRRHGAWLRLLAAARAVHGGVHHSQMNVPAYGGSLFSPIRHPFLEGTGVDGGVFDVGVVDDATVRHVLDLLQRLDGQRISYRAFSVEQIGQVYESLLDHSAVSVDEGDVVLGLVGSRGNEPEVSLRELETQSSKGKVAEWLAKEHDPSSGEGKKARWEARIAKKPDERVAATLGQACNGDVGILDRIAPYAGLLRTDARAVALVFLPGDVYVTESADRRDTGTAYTSPAFAAEIAQHALEPLVYEPGPHNEEDESKWEIKPPDEILGLRVCDPAVGSGAILVAAVRYLAEKLVEARLEHGELSPRDVETAAADPTSTDPHVQARRDVVAQSIYAVDQDPMAVEMAKLSLWLITMAQGRPFTFLDHAIKCGDSLLGVTSLDQLRRLHLDTSVDTQIGLDLFGSEADGLGSYFTMIDERINQALSLRELVREGDVRDAAEANHRAGVNAKADEQINDLRLVADAITLICYLNAGGSAQATEVALREQVLPKAAILESTSLDLATFVASASDGAPKFFHWSLEFPEVMGGRGFDAIVGNPPYVGGTLISQSISERYYKAIQRYVTDGAKTSRADLATFFVRRVPALGRRAGLILTSSLREGDSQEHGYRALLQYGWRIDRAIPGIDWAGRDAVNVSLVWFGSAPWTARSSLVLAGESCRVPYISSALGKRASVDLRVFALNHGLTAQDGVQPGGDGLMFPADSAYRYSPHAKPVINGHVAHSGAETDTYALDLTGWSESEVMNLVQERPVILRQKEAVLATSYSNWKNRWWEFRSPRRDLLQAVESLKSPELIAVVRHSKHMVPVMLPTSAIWTDSFVVFAHNDPALFAILHSELNWWWVAERGSTLETRMRYTTSDTLNTFPFVKLDVERLSLLGLNLIACRAKVAGRAGGVTKAMNMVHDPLVIDADIVALREVLDDINQALADIYGLSAAMRLGFHDVEGRGLRFTLSDNEVDSVLDELTHLNHSHYAQETGLALAAVKRKAQQRA